MTDSTHSSDTGEPRNEASWAHDSSALRVSKVPTGALNLNVEGRVVVGPLQGFGQLWQKTYRVRLPNVAMTPTEIVQIWKTNFPQFLPRANRFYPVLGTVEPGQIILINASMSGMPISTGVIVLYADDESFTLMTPQGHPESGWNTFSAYTEDGCTVCQIQSLARANDPLYEVGFRLVGASVQEHLWTHVLESLAGHFQINGQVFMDKVCLDPNVQWSEVGNLWQNAAVRTTLYTLSAPLRWLSR